MLQKTGRVVPRPCALLLDCHTSHCTRCTAECMLVSKGVIDRRLFSDSNMIDRCLFPDSNISPPSAFCLEPTVVPPLLNSGHSFAHGARVDDGGAPEQGVRHVRVCVCL